MMYIVSDVIFVISGAILFEKAIAKFVIHNVRVCESM